MACPSSPLQTLKCRDEAFCSPTFCTSSVPCNQFIVFGYTQLEDYGGTKMKVNYITRSKIILYVLLISTFVYNYIIPNSVIRNYCHVILANIHVTWRAQWIEINSVDNPHDCKSRWRKMVPLAISANALNVEGQKMSRGTNSLCSSVTMTRPSVARKQLYLLSRGEARPTSSLLLLLALWARNVLSSPRSNKIHTRWSWIHYSQGI